MSEKTLKFTEKNSTNGKSKNLEDIAQDLIN